MALWEYKGKIKTRDDRERKREKRKHCVRRTKKQNIHKLSKSLGISQRHLKNKCRYICCYCCFWPKQYFIFIFCTRKPKLMHPHTEHDCKEADHNIYLCVYKRFSSQICTRSRNRRYAAKKKPEKMRKPWLNCRH